MRRSRASDLRAAVEARNPRHIAHVAHRMVGAGRMLGFTALADACANVEIAARKGDLQTVEGEMCAVRRELERATQYMRGLAALRGT